MEKNSNEAVIEFTAKLTRNTEVIFSSPTFELEKGLVLKRTNRKRKKIIGYETCYNIIFKGQELGVLNAKFSNPSESICNIQFNNSIYPNPCFDVVFNRIVGNKFSLFEIIELKQIEYPLWLEGINSMVIKNAQYFKDEIVNEVKRELHLEIICFEMCWNEGKRNDSFKPSVFTDAIKLANAYGINNWLEEIVSRSNYS